jgi:hypothetical protein
MSEPEPRTCVVSTKCLFNATGRFAMLDRQESR